MRKKKLYWNMTFASGHEQTTVIDAADEARIRAIAREEAAKYMEDVARSFSDGAARIRHAVIARSDGPKKPPPSDGEGVVAGW